MDSATPKWQFPQKDVMENIARRLEYQTRTEILRLRAVCSGWRSSIPLPPPKHHLNSDGSPLKLQIPPIFPFNCCLPTVTGNFLLEERTIYCVEPLTENSSAWSCTNNWFVCIEEGDRDSGKVFLRDPFSISTKIKKNLGKIDRLYNKVINLLDYRVREVGKTYHLKFVEEASTQRRHFISIKKVVVGRNKNGDFCVMALNIVGELGFWKMGGYCAQIDDGRKESHYADIAFHNGRFYAVDYEGVTIAIDPLSFEVTQVAVAPLQYRGSFFYRYLVNSIEGLFLIDKSYRVEVGGGGGKTPCFKVCKFDEEIGNWISVMGLGDQVIFLGEDYCCSVSAKDLTELKKNCIYFTDGCFGDDAKHDDFPGWDAGLFNLEDNIARPLKSKIFWPPPTWIKKSPSRERTVESFNVHRSTAT